MGESGQEADFSGKRSVDTLRGGSIPAAVLPRSDGRWRKRRFCALGCLIFQGEVECVESPRPCCSEHQYATLRKKLLWHIFPILWVGWLARVDFHGLLAPYMLALPCSRLCGLDQSAFGQEIILQTPCL